MYKQLLIMVIVTLGTFAEKPTYGSAVVDSIISVYDGDTFRCDIQGYPGIIGANISIRIRGIDTPEIRGSSACEKKDAYMIRDYVEEKLRSAKTIILKDVGRPKYFRLLANVIIDGVDIGQELIRLGYASNYDGGKKTKWVCLQ